ncbi:hypothetical protein GH714_021414 [Hevea brasiliensis]|uniref:Uncharacterized protein n=1 Tax=Hevea brasiliensis TaxID=3981 RepID=A0A6A6M8H7_HEVBR|nr:hypothetical protein GH714_021414 [Hevea brasiliensis]
MQKLHVPPKYYPKALNRWTRVGILVAQSGLSFTYFFLLLYDFSDLEMLALASTMAWNLQEWDHVHKMNESLIVAAKKMIFVPKWSKLVWVGRTISGFWNGGFPPILAEALSLREALMWVIMICMLLFHQGISFSLKWVKRDVNRAAHAIAGDALVHDNLTL